MYYPKSQIKTNLYIAGGLLVLSSTKEQYIGYYYEISNGQKYTGKNPQDKPNILLLESFNNYDPSQEIPQKPSPLNYITLEDPSFPFATFNTSQYNQNNHITLNSINRKIPNFNQTFPTPQEAEIGQYTKYFCKKNNELIYLEIDKNTFTQLQNKESKIAWDLYTPTSIIWNTREAGLKPFINTNYSSVLKIEKDLKWYGFSQYFKNNFV
jgi:hypothetical protein